MFVIHPWWELSEKVAVNITDRVLRSFERDWKLVPNEVQYEFGYDGPYFSDSYMDAPELLPRKHVNMTFEEYVMLVQLYAYSEDDILRSLGNPDYDDVE